MSNTNFILLGPISINIRHSQGSHRNRRRIWGRLVWKPTHKNRRCHRNSSDFLFSEKLPKNEHTLNIEYW